MECAGLVIIFKHHSNIHSLYMSHIAPPRIYHICPLISHSRVRMPRPRPPPPRKRPRPPPPRKNLAPPRRAVRTMCPPPCFARKRSAERCVEKYDMPCTFCGFTWLPLLCFCGWCFERHQHFFQTSVFLPASSTDLFCRISTHIWHVFCHWVQLPSIRTEHLADAAAAARDRTNHHADSTGRHRRRRHLAALRHVQTDDGDSHCGSRLGCERAREFLEKKFFWRKTVV